MSNVQTGGSKEEADTWKTLHQELPEPIYIRLIVQFKRLALANGVSPESFSADSKFAQAVGPRVQVWECLLLLLERTESDDVLRV
jgi:hypothetical protein